MNKDGVKLSIFRYTYKYENNKDVVFQFVLEDSLRERFRLLENFEREGIKTNSDNFAMSKENIITIDLSTTDKWDPIELTIEVLKEEEIYKNVEGEELDKVKNLFKVYRDSSKEEDIRSDFEKVVGHCKLLSDILTIADEGE